MSDKVARDIVRTVRQFGSAKADPFEMLMVDRLCARGVAEDRARAAARECSNRIWRNGMVTGAAAVVLVGATSANVPAVVAGGSVAALGATYTLLLDNACREVRELSESDMFSAIDQLIGTD